MTRPLPTKPLARVLFGLAAVSFLAFPAYGQACAPDKHAPIEGVVDTGYDAFRAKLIETGWQPLNIGPMQRTDGDAEFGNGPAMLEAGFDELVSCAGTGLAQCRFEFTDVYSNRLAVITTGEVWADQPFPVVSEFMFVCAD